ncbi:flavin-dependent dehydrogenase [Neobacillus bataviensis]|uniref:Flavin-dependent dehydrogenase n=1 Tax=Neobacillus bataviensis TaxID=220685 RepID=A0A561DEV1_9BACI|nr:styrene monooxygenase/indole monooxygenase family protein [Neobacillus bataviensis]TWE01926.1 flavin-dependent dehydrogenase [Neobacillus bataviensis]
MKKRLCIIGSGVAGLHLAYALKDDFDITIIERQSSDQIKNGRIMSTQVHFGSTRNREKRFNVPKWGEQALIESIHITIGNQKLFVGKLRDPALSVDQRLYYSHSIKDLVGQGVSFRLEKVDKESVEVLIDEFDLVIDCTGKNGPLFPFPIEEDLSPFQTPQRKCIVGYFIGIKENTPLGVSVTVLPELGEMFEIPAITEHGPVTIMFIMAIPNSDLDIFKGIKNAEEFTLKMRSTVQQFFPEIYNRMDGKHFALCDENSFLQTAITPVIRKPYLLVNNKLVVGCGDSVFLNDPITGQGCNLSSYCAEQLYETLTEYKNSKWDAETGECYWNRTKQYVKEVTEWTNAMTKPLPEHVVQLLLQGAQDQVKANEIAEWFANPTKAYNAFFSKTTIH